MNDLKPIKIGTFTTEADYRVGYSDTSNINEFVFETEPERNALGQLITINQINRLVVPRLTITFNYLDIVKYREFYEATKPAEFVVEYYDLQADEMVAHKMYLKPITFPQYHMIDGEVKGVINLKTEFVGTLNDISELTVTYLANGGIGSIMTEIGFYGQEIQLSDGDSLSYSNKRLDSFNTEPDGSGVRYLLEQVINLTSNLTLYAIWKDTSDYVLSFIYGVGEIELDEYGDPLYSKNVVFGNAVGDLPNTSADFYTFVGWFSLPDGQGIQWTSSTIYNISGNAIIYAYMIPDNFTISFDSNGGDYTPVNIVKGYNTSIINDEPRLPIKAGYTFVGWYQDESLTQEFSWTTMPSENITLYAKWEEEV